MKSSVYFTLIADPCFGLTTFQVFNVHIWLEATVLSNDTSILYQILFHLREEEVILASWPEYPQGSWLGNMALLKINNSVHSVGGIAVTRS